MRYVAQALVPAASRLVSTLVFVAVATAAPIDRPAAASQAEAQWKAGRYKEANESFRAAVAASPRDPYLRVRWGRLFLGRYTPAEAEQLFKEALEIQKDYAPAYLGMALVAADAFDEKAVEFAKKALELDPKLLEAQELLGRLALEDGDLPRAAAEADNAAKINPNSPGVTAVRATIDWMQDREPKATNREAYALAGHVLILNRRYVEGIRLYQKAIELDPANDRVRSQLGINLMRLGRNEEARAQLEKAYDNGWRDAATANTLKLLDSYKNFVRRKTPTTIVVTNKKESDLLAPYIEAELQRAIATYEKKYRFKLTEPVQVEVYPNHEDFAVRTLGMPGLGALGVTFGYVVAMDSPSGRKPGSFHWASTLWHELSHVYVLTATKHRVPRWFTEGMAVYEETAAAPDWGDRLDPHVIDAIQKKRLLPVAQLDRGFVRPSYPTQVPVSYFQAGRVCEYIAEKWGYDKLLAMMNDFGASKTTPQVIEQELGMKPLEFDAKFQAWLDSQVGKVVTNFPDWKRRMRELSQAADAKRYEDVLRDGAAVRDLYPDYVEPGSAYELLADAYVAKGDTETAKAELERYAKIGGRSPKVLKQLAGLYEASGQRKEAIRTYDRLLYIYPMDEEVHRHLGDLLLAENNPKRAIMEFEAAVATNPIDQAASRFNLARALRAQNRVADAKEQLLLALEAAPGFKPAQKMLLELSQ